MTPATIRDGEGRDIVDRLLDYAANGYRPWGGIEAVFRDAAEEIVKLRAALAPVAAGDIDVSGKAIVVGTRAWAMLAGDVHALPQDAPHETPPVCRER
jgi:hypothetical protein